MCGLVGIFSVHGLEDDTRKHLATMAATIDYRGPDDDGIWFDGTAGIGLGSRRLAILDVSPQGHMPMISAGGRYVIAYNGEIYNYLELRTELESYGLHFRGHSDTEVLLEAINQWGLIAALEKSIGMFAFSLWDRSTRTLSLVRDRMGEKPLYWAQFGSLILFGSELKALQAHPAWRGEIDRGSLALLLRYGYITAPHSIFREARKIPPGTILSFSSITPEPHLIQYWNIQEVASHGMNKPLYKNQKDWVDTLEVELRRTLKREMIADVPIGAFLSGGVDSSTVVALMQQESTKSVRTFSIGFHEQAFNEAQYAKAVAAYLGTEHTEFYVSSDEAMSIIPRLAYTYDEPFADSSQIPTYLVSALARQQVKVVLSGDGGDELFGGYTRYHWTINNWRYFRRIPWQIRRIIACTITAAPNHSFNYAAKCIKPLLPERFHAPQLEPKIRDIAEFLTALTLEELYLRQMSYWQTPAEVIIGAEEPPTVVSNTSLWPHIGDPVACMMLVDQQSYLPDDILVKSDRASMSNSLELRVPFLDHKLIELSWCIPMNQKVANGIGKLILKRLLARYIPPELTERPKMGFGIPLNVWLRGPLRAWADTLLAPDLLSDDGFFKPKSVRYMWDKHISGTRDYAYALWNVLMFQAWLHR